MDTFAVNWERHSNAVWVQESLETRVQPDRSRPRGWLNLSEVPDRTMPELAEPKKHRALRVAASTIFVDV